MPLSDIVSFKAGQDDFFQIDPSGRLWHKWSDDGGNTWTNEALPSFVAFRVARPVTHVTAAGVEVLVEDAEGFAYRYFQAVDSSTWKVGKLP